ncbi:uncharacterized protein LOC116925712 [Daphnia magna]|uniref:uncharacterized protein LOC116925712 n=1 Tax=Daphnia magna TaxID=35525 RepID=UPI001E1BA1C5|nr:uncharacterized protein LOC116925712 [Daphnia magna]
MMKVLVALIPLLAICSGQFTNLTNSQELDPAGNFRLSWEVIPDTGDIVLEIQAKTAGWVSLEIVTDDGKYADVIFGGYNDELNTGYIEDWSLEWTPGAHLLPIPDANNDIVLQSASYSDPNTILRVKRALNTGDYYDVPIHSGVMPMGWSYSASDAYDSVHAAAGFVYITFY